MTSMSAFEGQSTKVTGKIRRGLLKIASPASYLCRSSKKPSTLQKFSIGTVAFVALIYSGCVNSPTRGEIKPPKNSIVPKISQLTDVGQNRRPRYTAHSAEIVMVSSDRLKHKNWQAYVKTVSNAKDRRITFQDGDIYDIAWSVHKGRFIYSSSSDTLKEASPLDRKTTSETESNKTVDFLTRPNTEVYLVDELGEDSDRLTREEKFDGDVDPHPKRAEFLYVSAKSDNPRIMIKSYDGSARRLTKDNRPEAHPRFTAAGNDVVWSVQAGPSASEIRRKSLANAQENVITSGQWNLEPSWHPSGEEVVFASDRQDGNFEIYLINKNGSCLRRLTYHGAEDREPAFSPDGSKIVFASRRSGSWQIHEMTGTLPPCP